MIAGCAEENEEAATRSTCADFRFDRQGWRAEDSSPDGPTARQRLADRIVECEILMGQTKKDVRRLLGPPDQSDSEVFAYFLGDERGAFVVDGEFMDVEFSPDGQVVDVQISSG